MKLYYSPGACSLSPHIVLVEAGLDYELEKVDLAARKTAHDADFLRINPKGYVPALELADGQVLTEGPAIVQYLADQVPDRKLVPLAGTWERYRTQEWLNFISTELHKGFGALFNSHIPEAWQAVVKETLAKRLEFVAARLDGGAYIAGDDFTVADAYLFTVLRWHTFVAIDLAPWPVLSDYLARVAARPPVRQAMTEEGLIRRA